MHSNPRHNRHSIRLKGFDYTSSGAYFITICTHQRACWLGEIVDESFLSSEYGQIVQETWGNLSTHYTSVSLDAFIIMPNHLHGIILLGDGVGAGLKPAPTGTKQPALSEVIRSFKTFSACRINEQRKAPGSRVWQRNYYEHIIRSETSLNRVREYIMSNPARWNADEENPLLSRSSTVERIN